MCNRKGSRTLDITIGLVVYLKGYSYTRIWNFCLLHWKRFHKFMHRFLFLPLTLIPVELWHYNYILKYWYIAIHMHGTFRRNNILYVYKRLVHINSVRSIRNYIPSNQLWYSPNRIFARCCSTLESELKAMKACPFPLDKIASSSSSIFLQQVSVSPFFSKRKMAQAMHNLGKQYPGTVQHLSCLICCWVTSAVSSIFFAFAIDRSAS